MFGFSSYDIPEGMTAEEKPRSILWLKPRTHAIIVVTSVTLCTVGAFYLVPETWGVARTVAAGVFSGVGALITLLVLRSCHFVLCLSFWVVYMTILLGDFPALWNEMWEPNPILLCLVGVGPAGLVLEIIGHRRESIGDTWSDESDDDAGDD